MESSLPWNNTFSPNTPSGATPGKSPYYPELDSSLQQHPGQHQQHQQQPSQHQLHEGSTPTAPSSSLLHDTPSNFTDSEHMFLQHLESNLYEDPNGAAAAHNAPASQNSSATTPASADPSTYTHHHHHHHHHHHVQDQSHGNTPSSRADSHPKSTSGTPAAITPGAYGGSHTPSGSHPPSGAPPPPQFYEFGLENMNFIIPEDLNFGAEPSQPQTAFPPSAVPPNQTPSMLAANKARQADTGTDPKRFASPILPSQNDKSYNNQHFYHKHTKSIDPASNTGSSSSASAPHQHVRPDAVFTPLVSPAVTPLDSQVNVNKSSFSQPPVQTSFEPLTSPALNAQPSSSAGSDRRRTSSSAFGPTIDENSQYSAANPPSSSYHKRRTPHGTPILQANSSSGSSNALSNGRHGSPSLKGRQGSAYKSSPKHPFERLPDSTMDSGSSTPMLPPSSKKVGINSAAPSGASAPLMGFTMGRLAEQSQTEDDELDPDADFDLDKPKKGTGKLSRSSSLRANKAPLSRTSSTSSIENSPKLHLQKGSISDESGGSGKNKPVTKKASHKLAEQGRRNRMNTAVQELGTLVPKSYHEEVSIPSKATTVELASNYIRDLLAENDRLKRKLQE